MRAPRFDQLPQEVGDARSAPRRGEQTSLRLRINPSLSAKQKTPSRGFFVVHFDGWSAEPDAPEVGERLYREIVTRIAALTGHPDMACIVPGFDLPLPANARACLTSLPQQAPA